MEEKKEEMGCFKLAPMIAFQKLMNRLAIKGQTGHSELL
jgi:hypothetical protein